MTFVTVAELELFDGQRPFQSLKAYSQHTPAGSCMQGLSPSPYGVARSVGPEKKQKPMSPR